jgi:molybdate transport system substrate-binding protein
MRVLAVVLGVGLLALCSVARAASVTVAAAADLKFAMDEIVAAFTQAHPEHRVVVSYGSSGNFFAQIRNGAPFDLYLSADIAYPRALAEAGAALDGEVFLYAIGRLSLWAPASSALDVEGRNLDVLTDGAVRRIAIANPRHAPYGVAAVATLRAAGLYERVEPRLVFGENAAQTAQFVETGAADVGLVPRSLAVAARMRAGRVADVPASLHPPLEQGGIVLARTRNADAAQAFRDFLLGEIGLAVLLRNGFEPPPR